MEHPTLYHRLEQAVRAYIQACNDADVEAIAACFCAESVHYFPHAAKWLGGTAIGANFAKSVRERDAFWTVDQLLIDVGRYGAVLEWTRFDRSRQLDRVLRGVDWYVFEPQTLCIKKIRPYTAAPIQPDIAHQELRDFDYAGRGYPVTHTSAA